ncbi:hypothetical protein F4824DRAFT_160209 [Ustulina deusta]|nr:hypothetical protein F4824DRAFT_160209 [Ustulina deusta]
MVILKWQSRVSNAHYFKFRRTGLLGDINTAIETCVLAMGTDALTTQQRWALETKLATYMLDRTELFPSAEHRLEAISHHRKYSEMEGLCPSGRARFLSQFGVSLSRQYLISGDSRLLDEALRLGYESTDSSNLQDPKQADIEFSNLASTLFMSFRHTQRFSDLEAALQISQLAIDNEVRDDMLERAGMLVTRGGMLTTKYQRYRNTKPEVAQEALDEAIKHGRRAALILKPVGPSSEAFQIHRKANLLNSIAPWFATKMMLTGTLDWGQEGITLLREALELRPEDHPERLSILAHLSHILEVQHQVLKSQKDTQAALAKLGEALKCGAEAAEATPELDSDRGERCMNVGKMLLSKYILTGAREPAAESTKYFHAVARLDSAPILLRIPAAIQAAWNYLTDSEVFKAHQLLQESISLLPGLNMGMLSTDDLRATLTQISGLLSLAASVALEVKCSPYEALQSLEVGRCIISGFSMSSKSDTTQLRRRDEKLASEYESIRKALVEVALKVNVTDAQWRDQARIQQKWLIQTLAAKEAEIRALDGFESSQLPPSQKQLQDMARDGPTPRSRKSRQRVG